MDRGKILVLCLAAFALLSLAVFMLTGDGKSAEFQNPDVPDTPGAGEIRSGRDNALSETIDDAKPREVPDGIEPPPISPPLEQSNPDTVREDPSERMKRLFDQRIGHCDVEGVVRLRGVPQPGAEIIVAHELKPEETFRVKADEEGRYRFQVSRMGWYLARVDFPGAYRNPETIKCRKKNDVIKMDLDYHQGRVQVIGRLTDTEDNPLADSSIRLVMTRGGKVASQFHPVDEQGNFEIWLGPESAKYFVYASAPGHSMQIRRFTTDDRTRIEMHIRLPRDATMQGLVVGPDGEPRPGVYVYYRIQKESGSGPSGMRTTDKDGRFAFTSDPNTATLAAWDGDGGLWGKLDVPARDEAADAQGLVIRLQPGRSLSGRVLLESGKPVPDTPVGFWFDELPLSISVRTDETGAFKVDGLPPDAIVNARASWDKRPLQEPSKRIPPEQSRVDIPLNPIDGVPLDGEGWEVKRIEP